MWCEARYARQQRPDVTMAEAAEMLGVMEQTFHRWSGWYDGRAPRGYGIGAWPAFCPRSTGRGGATHDDIV